MADETWTPEMQELYNRGVAGMTPEQREQLNHPLFGAKLKEQLMNAVRKHPAAGGPDDPGARDPMYQYGGRAGKAYEDAAYFRQRAEAAQGRQGEQIDYTRANQWDHRSGDWDRAAGESRTLAWQARQPQMRMADMLADRAMGRTPSIAQMQADRQMGQMAREQSSAAASARGPAAIALAQQQAAANTAAGQSAISNQAQINAAQERQQAEQAAMGAYSNIRAQDYQGQQNDLSGAQTTGALAQAAGARSQAQAQMNQAQRAQNDAYSQSMYGNEMGVNTTQLQANQNRKAHMLGLQGMQMQASQAEQARDDAKLNAMLGMGASVLGTAASVFSPTSDIRSKKPASLPTSTPPKAKEPEKKLTMAERLKEGGGKLGQAISAPLMQAAAEQRAMAARPIQIPDFQTVPLGPSSDERAKKEVSITDLAARPGYEKHWDKDVPILEAADQATGASLSGPAKRYSSAVPEAPKAKEAPAPARERKFTNDELLKFGQEALANAQAQRSAQLEAGPSVGAPPAWLSQYMSGGSFTSDERGKSAGDAKLEAMKDANRSMAASPYTYKPGMAEANGQTPDEVNVGPMAQKMAKSPVAATAVEKDPNTGMLALDRDKMLKVVAGGVASLQQQVDGLMARRLRGKR